MNFKKENKGTLRQARLFDFAEGKKWVEGLIYGHPGFRDGEYIHTSSVVDIRGNEVETRNSLYTVEWAPGHGPALQVPTSDQVEDSPITPSVPLELVNNELVATLPEKAYATILEDQGGAPEGSTVVVTRHLADGTIFYDYGVTRDFIADPGTYSFVGEPMPQEKEDPALLRNIAEQFVLLFDSEELRHVDIEYFADAFKDALRG